MVPTTTLMAQIILNTDTDPFFQFTKSKQKFQFSTATCSLLRNYILFYADFNLILPRNEKGCVVLQIYYYQFPTIVHHS